MEIETPQHLVDLLKQVTLSPKEKLKLNKELANDIRNFFRKRITAQEDIYGKAYKPRKNVAIKITKAGKIKKSKKMFTALSRNINSFSTEHGLEVGLSGSNGAVAKKHNDGKTQIFRYRKNGFFNQQNQKWEGGVQVTSAYKLPKRQMIGWSTKLEMQLANKIMKHIKPTG